jgi:hypothetical protein
VTTELQRARTAAAHREGTRPRLIRSDRLPEELVDRWMAAWEGSSEGLAIARSSSEFWHRGYKWIHGERAAGRTPDKALDASAETME